MTAVFVTAAALVPLALICMKTRVGSRFHRAVARSVSAIWVLMALSALPGFRVGVNALSVACAGVLGLPGIGLMQVVAMMP
ncbi:MAG: pro-sigmaK processing inhibitor BofA family protein [Clostridia bacterium]|nr:pro-sigmaK processing inhibitor BofA family protein [Clostridia bacterium]